MMTLRVFLITLLCLQFASAQRLTPLPQDDRFDTPISLSTAVGGESLSAIITAIASSVGLTPVLEGVPEELVSYDIADPKPFRQIWNLVLSLNGLDYRLLDNDIVVIGTPEAITNVRQRSFVDGENVTVVTRFYFTTFVNPEQIAARLNTILENVDTDDLQVLEDFLRATADANPQLQSQPANNPMPQPQPDPADPATDPQGNWQDDSEPVVLLADASGMFFAQAPQQAEEAMRLVEQLVDIRVDNDVLVVSAPEGIIDQLERIITALDSPSQRPATPDPIVRRSYQLANANVADLAVVLREALTGVSPPEEAQTTQVVQADDEENNGNVIVVNDNQQPTVEAAALVGSEQIAIAADARTNRIIVTAPLSVQEEIEALVEELDVPQLQVSVQVRIQQVSRSFTQSLGLNVNGGVGNLTAQLLENTGLSFVFDAQRAISGANFGATLDALEQQGLSRSIDDSTLTVLSNETASFNSGGRIEVIVDGGGGQPDEIVETQFGSNIQVSPRIGSDGRLILNVTAEVSELITPDSQRDPRVFTENTITSTVTLEPGQTVLLGGLFENSLTDSVVSVPILGSIPILGELFRSRVYEEDNSELLLVVTADIIE